MSRWQDSSEALPKAKISKSNLKKAYRVLQYMKPYRWKFFLGLLFLFLTSAVALVFPMLIGKLVDAAKSDVLSHIDKIALYLLVLFTAQAFFSYNRIVLFASVTENTLATLRQVSYQHLITLPMSFFSQRRVGELNSRISADISQLQDTMSTTVAEFLRQIILIIGGIIFLSYTSIQLTVFMLALLPVLVVVAVFFGRYIRNVSRNVQDKIADSNTIVEETLQGIASVKAFANELFEVKRYVKSTNEVIGAAMKGARMRGAFASFIVFCLFGAIVAVVWYGVRMVNAGNLSVGKLFSFVLYSVFVGASIGGVAELYAQIQKAIGATERIVDMLDETGEKIDFNTKIILDADKIKGNVQFSEVGFSYPSRKEFPVLKNISFDARKGERIALVGPSGAGKSTIVSLLLRFYDVEKGKILIDEKMISEYSLTLLRNQMAIVPQDVLLFGGTIKENIAYGKPDATIEEIINAAKNANAHDFIESFPERYETIVGERGIKLSGGQRQRIAIARAVLKNPSILLLDEATSSLDSESERLVQEALDKLMVGRTTFIIAHRLATVRSADKIIVIENGIVKETGRHEDLVLIENGLYKYLSQMQFQMS